MPRDMTGTGRYPPVPKYPPFAFYSCVRLGDPEQLAKVMAEDPYFWTQDNGAGAPLHFAVTFKQLDMVHHILNNGGEVNQRDQRGMTPLHRAAYLAQVRRPLLRRPPGSPEPPPPLPHTHPFPPVRPGSLLGSLGCAP